MRGRKNRILVLGGLLLGLSGCSDSGLGVQADPISGSTYFKTAESYVLPLTNTSSTPTLVDETDYNNQAVANLLGLVVMDSEAKCATFTRGEAFGQTYSNVGLSIATTVSGAIGAIVTPLGITHAFSAATAIASGTRSDVNTNIFQSETIYLLDQAIKAKYYVDVANYQKYLASAASSSVKLNIGIELGRIEAIHAECSLASAESTLSNSLSNPTGPATAKTTTTLDVSDSHATGKEQFTLSGITGGGTSLSVPAYQPKSGENSAAIALAISNNISLSQQMQGAGVSAQSGTDSTPSLAHIILTWPSSSNITWTASVQQGESGTSFSVEGSAGGEGPAGGAASATAGSCPNSGNSSSPPVVVPGTAVSTCN